MLTSLGRRLGRIVAGQEGEAALYGDAASHRLAPLRRPPPPGVLECPICGLRARRFLPFGLARRPNALCPGCGSLERHRLLWLYLRTRTDLLTTRRRVLHTAAEPALAERLRARHGRGYRTVDPFDPTADVRAPLTALPFADGWFDAVISCHVLEHVADDRAALAELARVLAPGGRLILLVPYDPTGPTREDPSLTTPAARLAAYGHPFHYRIYGHDLGRRLAEAGLVPTVLAARQWLSAHRRRRFRLNQATLFSAVKQA